MAELSEVCVSVGFWRAVPRTPLALPWTFAFAPRPFPCSSLGVFVQWGAANLQTFILVLPTFGADHLLTKPVPTGLSNERIDVLSAKPPLPLAQAKRLVEACPANPPKQGKGLANPGAIPKPSQGKMSQNLVSWQKLGENTPNRTKTVHKHLPCIPTSLQHFSFPKQVRNYAM